MPPDAQQQPQPGAAQSAIAALFPAMQQPPTAGAPAAPGAAMPAPASSPNLTDMMTQAAQTGMESYKGEAAKTGALGSQVEGLVQAQGQQPLPPTGPHIQRGGGFLHNLGQALQMISMITKPGQAVFGPGGPVYGPGIRTYEAEHATRAQQIQELTGQEKEHEALATAGAGMVSKPITALGTEERGRGVLQGAQAKAQEVRNNFDMGMQRIEQGAQGLKLKGAALEALKQYHQAYLQSFDRRTQANEDVAMAMVGAKQDAAAASNIDKFQEVHPLLSILGIGPEPVAPAGAKTTPGSATTAKPTSKPATGKMRVKLADGRTGTIDAKDFDAKTMTKVQ